MADIRIKDLTTTASSTASDDFIAVDGTTNGTRKLNAFSPTFGGNAVVTGTLTAGGGILSAGVSGSVTVNSTGTGALKIDNPTNPNLYFYSNGTLKTQINYVASSSSFVVDHADQSEIKLNVFGGGTTTVGGRLLVSSTTASTTTSTGALVIGNGTSGGLGVGGAVNIGGTLTVNGATAFVGANTGSPYVLIKGGSSGTNGGGSLVVENGSGGSVIGIGNVSAIAGGAYNNDPVVWYAGSESLRFYNAGTEVANFSSTGVLSLLSTTASTTTSSGALVVSGGVGVAGAVNAGTFYGLVDGVTAPATESGYARIYVDSADGDLKVKFGDGTVKTIATDS